MSEKPTYEQLQAEIESLKNKLQAYQDNAEPELQRLQQHWQQIILQKELSDQDIVTILAELVAQIGVRTAVLYDYDPLLKEFGQTHCYPTVDETLSANADASDEEYPYMSQQMRLGNTLIINHLDDFPPDSPDKQHLSDANQLNLLAIPIMHDGVLLGSLDIHNGKSTKTWTEFDIKLAHIAAPMLYQAYQQLKNDTYKHWLNHSTQQLSKDPQIETIENCLYELCQLINIDGINLFVNRSQMDNKPTVVSCFPSIPEDELEKKPVGLDGLPWSLKKTQNNEPVIINNIETMPPEAQADKALLAKHKNFSYLIIPLHHNGHISAMLDLYTVDRTHEWSSREIDHVKKVLPLLFTAYEQIQLQRRREESLTTLQLVLDTTNVGYGIINKDLSEFYFSTSTATLMGYPKTQVITPDWVINHLLWDDKVRADDEKIRSEVFRTKQSCTKVVKTRSATGNPQWLFANYTPNTYKKNGDVESVLIGFSDLTSQVQRQDALEKARIEADEANAAKSEFLARMSHEIRTPMNAIIGMAHLIQDTDLDEKQIEQISHIDQAAQNLLGIINDILDFSKIESGKLELETTDFDLPSLLDQVLQVVSFHSKSREQELILDIHDNVPKRLKGDPLRITQILTNLLSNAVKFTRKGNITLQIDAIEQGTNTKLNFVISDQGIGMTSEQLDKLFQPFTQADGTISREFGGTGLGLSIVKRLIELMGSTIKVDSTPGEGSTFNFSLNLQEADYEAEQVIELNQLRTLVVDDNPHAREVICNIARSLQLPVKEACSAQEAIDLIHQVNNDPEQQFELVLMDYRMPEIDGLHAAQIIKQDSTLEHIPTVIMVSACDRDEVMKSQLSQYLEGFISKPVSASRLYNSVNHLLYQEHTPIALDKDTATQLKGIHILLVEDNIVNQKVAQGILKKQGVTTTIANNGQEAIDSLMIKDNHYDAVLMDIEMPKVDGYQATAFIREHLNLSIPIIAMTAHAMSSDRAKCLAAGMNDHIHKPIKPDLLYKALSTFTQPANN